MKPASAKAKGRRLQNDLRDMISTRFGLEEGDVKAAVMGEKGADMHLSPAARKLFPYAVEAKNVERLNVWTAYDQAASNAGKLEPLLVMKRNRSKLLVVVSLDHFMDLVERSKGEV